MKRKGMIGGLVFLLLIALPLALAHGAEDFAQAETIIQQKIPCENLSDDQLALLGDYFMEQMHPGEQHEQMDAMMGGEGSEQLRQMHIRMARAFYCGEHEMMSQEMMGMMMNNGMMAQGMMNNGQNMQGGETMMQGPGMMGSFFGMGNMTSFGMGFGMVFWWLIIFAVSSFVFGIIFWWTKQLVLGKR